MCNLFVLTALNIYGGNFHCGKSRESYYERYIELETHFESYAHGFLSRIQFLMQISDGDDATTSRFQLE